MTKKRHTQIYTLQVIVEQDEDGVYVADCPALQGCSAQGATFEEAIENVKDVIKMCLEEMRAEKAKITLAHPEVVGLKYVKVSL